MTNHQKILLITEGKQDIDILIPILKAAQLPVERIRFIAAGGRNASLKMAQALNGTLDEYTAIVVLMDADAQTVPDAALKQKETFSEKGIDLFFAIPETEAWVFADERLLLQQPLHEGAKEKLMRLSLPEELPYPRQLTRYFLKNQLMDWRFLEQMDIARATARTPALKIFLSQLGALLGMELPMVQNAIAHQLDRKLFANLIREVMPSQTVLYKTLDGRQFTAEQILENVQEGTNIGKQYASDILRVARDFLKRQANRSI
jgi:hypothetical protein